VNSTTWIKTDNRCSRCKEPMDVSKDYHGYSDSYNYYLSCSAACYIEFDLDNDDTSVEITFAQYLELVTGC